jgi:hypothetical protein
MIEMLLRGDKETEQERKGDVGLRVEVVNK